MDQPRIQKMLEMMLKSRNVYEQTPATIKMSYPCFIYHRDKILANHANNRPYKLDNRYTLIYVSRTPDDPIVDELAKLPMCEFDRHYVADKLHNYVYTIFFEGGNYYG